MGVDTILRIASTDYKWWRGYTEIDVAFLHYYFRNWSQTSKWVERTMETDHHLYLKKADLEEYLRIALTIADEYENGDDDSVPDGDRAEEIRNAVCAPLKELIQAIDAEKQLILWVRS